MDKKINKRNEIFNKNNRINIRIDNESCKVIVENKNKKN